MPLTYFWDKLSIEPRQTSGGPCSAILTLKTPKIKIVKFANSVDQDEVAHIMSHLLQIYTVCPVVFKA